MSKRNDQELTAAEERFVRDAAPDAVARFVAERRNIAVRRSAYEKIAAAARAERLAITEVHLLQLAAMGIEPIALEEENRALRAELVALRAAPAMAIHAGKD